MTPDPSTTAGALALERLGSSTVGWLTTVTPDGQPQSSVVWFLWVDGEILLYSFRRAHRNGNVEGRPLVSFSLDTTDDGNSYVTMEGTARVDPTAPHAAANPEYLAKYSELIAGLGSTPEEFSGEYSVPIRISPTRWRVA